EEKQALRIQAAAVAAQQAALTEEELQLQQRKASLEQHERQLAGHLDQEQQRLVGLRDEARHAHAALKQDRAVYEQRVAQIMADLARTRSELTDAQKQLESERRRLLDLRQRLKRRFHRHWAAERSAMRRRDAEVAHQRRELSKEDERLKRATAQLQ